MNTKKLINKKILFAHWSCKNPYYHTHQLWDSPLRAIFKEVIIFDPQEEIYKYGREEMNKKFLELISIEKPDIIFLQIIYDEFYLSTLKIIRDICPKTKIINYSGDDDTMFYSQSLVLFPLIDYFFITQPEYIKLYKKFGKKAFFIFGGDPEKFKPLNIEKNYDVTFIGTPKADRIEYIRYLKENGVNIKLFGSGWNNYIEFKNINGGRLDNKAFVETINKSKINIIFCKNYLGGTHVLERLPAINLCKSFSLVEYSKGYYEIFKEGENIITFKDKQDLLNKINYYIKREKEREKIALNSYNYTIKNLLFKNSMKKAFEYIILDNKVKREEIIGDKYKSEYILLDKNDLNYDINTLKQRLSDYKYIGFFKNGLKPLEYREYLQISTLEKSKKNVSCCDYYLYSKIIGDYAKIHTQFAEIILNKKNFIEILDATQLIVKKEFFFDNYERFKLFYDNKLDNFFDGGNIVFISFPIIRLKKRKYLNFNRENEAVFSEFEIKLLNLKNQRKIFTTPFFYKLIIYSIIFNPWIIKRLFETGKRQVKKYLT